LRLCVTDGTEDSEHAQRVTEVMKPSSLSAIPLNPTHLEPMDSNCRGYLAKSVALETHLTTSYFRPLFRVAFLCD